MSTKGHIQNSNVERAWQNIFADIQIDSTIRTKGFYDIESRVIKNYYEPRIACKIDFREKTPKVLSKRKLSLLAIKNGLYRIAETDPFIDINITQYVSSPRAVVQPKSFHLPDYIETLSPRDITSESKALAGVYRLHA